jgi:hypothetical protein
MFTIADVICMVIQGIGGGQTGGSDDTEGLKNGLRIMAIGVIAQSEHILPCLDASELTPVIVSAIFIAFLAEATWRLYTDRPTARSINLLLPFTCCAKPFRRRPRRREDSGANSPGSDEIALNHIKPSSRVSRNSEGQPVINGVVQSSTRGYKSVGGDLIFGQGKRGTMRLYKTMLLVMAFTTVIVLVR